MTQNKQYTSDDNTQLQDGDYVIPNYKSKPCSYYLILQLDTMQKLNPN